MIVRSAQMRDKQAFEELWDISFGDSMEFRTWFFENRFVPEYSACVEEDGTIVSAMQSLPLHINVRGHIVPAAMIAGVCTHPDYKGKGYMGHMFKFFMQQMRNAGITLTPHTPAHLPTFFSRGHLPVSDVKHLNIANAHGKKLPLFEGGLDELLPLYAAFSQKFSGMISRSMSDFKLKMADYFSDGGKCVYLKDRAYAVIYETDDGVHAEEVVYLDGDALNQLIEGLFGYAHGKKLHMKLPASAPVDGEIQTRNVCGVANVSHLLHAALNTPDYSIEVFDDTLIQNCGIYDLSGNLTEKKQCMKLTAGHLAQWVFGYQSLEELKNKNVLEIYDEKAVKELDRLFPKQDCFIVDEY